MLLGETICRVCYLRVHSVTEYAYREALRLFRSMQLPQEHADRAGRPSVKFQLCVGFVHQWIALRSVSTSRDGRRHLPFWPRISWLYYDFREFCITTFVRSVPSEETFRIAAKQELSTVSLPRGNADLKGCTTCTRNVLAFEKAATSKNPDEAQRIRALQREHEEIAMAERHNYHDRRRYAQDHPGAIWMFVQDWTHPFLFPIMHQRTADRDHCQKFAVNYFVQINHSQRHTTDEQGVNFFWFVGGDGKDDGNANASAICYNISKRAKEGPMPLRADIQLDSGSGGKCCLTISVLAYLMEVKKFFPDGIDVHFMISGHTGDDMDAVTAHVRSKCHQFGNWWSVDEVLRHFPKFYPLGRPPKVTLFTDFEEKADHRDTLFNARFADHFYFDWITFLAPYANRLSGICDKNVTRTEDTIHHWALRLDGARATLRVARRSSGPAAVLSDPVFLLHSAPPATGPSRVFFCDEKHKLAGGVNLPHVLACFMKEQESSMPDAARLFYGGLLDEMQMCEFSSVAPALPLATSRRKVVKRVVNLQLKPVLACRPPKGVVVSRAPAAARTRGSGQARESDSDSDSDEMEDLEVPGAAVDGDGESEGEEESSEEQLFRNAATGEVEFEVEQILDKEMRRGKAFYLVQYKTTDGEPASWQPVEFLSGAEEIVAAFETKRAAADKARNTRSYKELNRALNEGPVATAQLSATLGRTRSAGKKK